jgi:hypothetical protein
MATSCQLTLLKLNSSINMPYLKQPGPAYPSKYPAYARLFHSVLYHTAIPADFQVINTMEQ